MICPSFCNQEFSRSEEEVTTHALCSSIPHSLCTFLFLFVSMCSCVNVCVCVCVCISIYLSVIHSFALLYLSLSFLFLSFSFSFFLFLFPSSIFFLLSNFSTSYNSRKVSRYFVYSAPAPLSFFLVPQEFLSYLAEQLTENRTNSVRRLALRYAIHAFPFDHVDSTMMCLLYMSSDVKEEAIRGLSPYSKSQLHLYIDILIHISRSTYLYICKKT